MSVINPFLDRDIDRSVERFQTAGGGFVNRTFTVLSLGLSGPAKKVPTLYEGEQWVPTLTGGYIVKIAMETKRLEDIFPDKQWSGYE